MAFFRTLIWFIRFWLYQLIAIPALFKIRRLGRQGKTAEHDALLHRIVGRWARTMFTMAGGHVRVEGLNNLVDGPAVYVANHLGYFDIPLMIGFLGDDTKPMVDAGAPLRVRRPGSPAGIGKGAEGKRALAFRRLFDGHLPGRHAQQRRRGAHL